jgi:tRNA G18 (ribose-2'-O)-methylase SpoU
VIVPLSAEDPRVGDYRSIPEPEVLRARGLFVAEGRRVAERLVRSGRFPIRSLLVAPAALDALQAALAPIDLHAASFPVFVADVASLSAIGGFNFHRGCLALAERPEPQTIADILATASAPARVGAPSTADRMVVLAGLAQADNVGSVFRNAAAFGAAAVILDPACCDPLYRKALRTSTGAILDLPWARTIDVSADLQALRASGYRLIALTPSADARSIVDAAGELTQTRVALLVGAEDGGLSPQLIALADARVRIPMAAGVDSLNVATATGIALHRLHA